MLGAKTCWRSELSSEIEFWNKWFATRGLDWPEDFRNRLQRDLPLQESALEYLSHLEQEEIDILDVGAGPLTLLGKVWPGRRLHLTPVDPLADAYDRIMAQHEIVPPVRTTWCHGEMLAERFAYNSFDLVWAQNSVDHSYDPTGVIEQALCVVRLGCWVVLVHSTNEAINENWSGLHQWNFCGENGDFVIWNRTNRVNVSQRLRPYADIRCRDDGKGVTVEFRKTAELPPRPDLAAELTQLKQECSQLREANDTLRASLPQRTVP